MKLSGDINQVATKEDDKNMGDAKRRKESDPNYGKGSHIEWNQYSINPAEFQPISDKDKLSDFGQVVYEKIGDKPLRFTLISKSSLLRAVGNFWVLDFVTDACMMEPFLMLENPCMGLVELGKIDKESALAIGEQLLQEGILIKAKYEHRYWSPITEEMIVPFELVN